MNQGPEALNGLCFIWELFLTLSPNFSFNSKHFDFMSESAHCSIPETVLLELYSWLKSKNFMPPFLVELRPSKPIETTGLRMV